MFWPWSTTVDQTVTGKPRRYVWGATLFRSRIVRSSVLGIVVTVSSLLPFLLAPVRASWLGPEARGAFAYFQSSVMVITAVSVLGLRFAVYSLDASGNRRFKYRLGPTIRRGIAAAAMCAVPLGAIGWFRISPFIGLAVAAVVLLVPGWVVNQSELANAQILRRDRRLAVGMSSASVVDFTLNILTVVTHTLTLVSSVAVTIAAELSRITASLLWRRSDRRDSSQSPEAKASAALARASLGFSPAVILPVVAANVDILIYGAILPGKLVGVYAVAKLGFSLYLPIIWVAEGRVLDSFGRGSLRRTMAALAGTGIGLGVAISAAAFVLLPPLFGEAYLDAVWVIPVACVAGTLRLIHDSLAAVAASGGFVGLTQLSSSALIAVTLTGGLIVATTGGELLLMMTVLVLSQLAGLAILLRRDVLVPSKGRRS